MKSAHQILIDKLLETPVPAFRFALNDMAVYGEGAVMFVMEKGEVKIYRIDPEEGWPAREKK